MKKSIAAIALLGITITSQANADWTDLLPKFLKSNEVVFVEYCEATFKDRLKAPTTYTRIDYGFRQVNAIPEQVIYADQKANKEYRVLLFAITERRSSTTMIEDIVSVLESFAQPEGSFRKCYENSDCPYRGLAIVKYTAENAFGAPLADYFECIVNYKKSLSEVESSDVYVNGYTRKQWFSKAIGE